MFNVFKTDFSINYGKFKIIDIKDLNINSNNNLNTINLIEEFSKRISMPVVEYSLEGFSESKLPEDYLIKIL